MEIQIELLTEQPASADFESLARLLVDTVAAGAAISFLPPVEIETARAWWQDAVAKPGTHTLVARLERAIVGTVQLHRAWAPNQPHRGDVAKLIVDSNLRRGGVATTLMGAVELLARKQGLTLLVLDTKRGDGAESLYRRLGYSEAGVIPRYALNSDGTFHDTVIFYKDLGEAGGA